MKTSHVILERRARERHSTLRFVAFERAAGGVLYFGLCESTELGALSRVSEAKLSQSIHRQNQTCVNAACGGPPTLVESKGDPKKPVIKGPKGTSSAEWPNKKGLGSSALYAIWTFLVFLYSKIPAV